MGMGIIPAKSAVRGTVRVMDRHVRAHPLGHELVPNKLRNQFPPCCPVQLYGKGGNKLTGKAAVFGFLRFLHGVP